MEARGTSRVARKNAAFEVKAEGNERFRNGRLRSALECYEEAVRMDPTEPVFYANRSTCLFELGEYGASCEDSKQATMLYRDKQKIGMISRADANNVIGKLLRQSARCFLCMNTRESLEAARSLLARCIELHPDPDAELLSMHESAVAAVAEAQSASAGEASGPSLALAAQRGLAGRGGSACGILPRYRSPVVNGPTPYSCIGWETALSGLAGRVPSPADTESPFSAHGGTFGDDEDDGAIDLAARPEGERALNLLFGGLGDARQVLATFRDIYQQVGRNPGRLPFQSVSLSLILNDVKAECLTRAIVMFRALEALGRALQQAAAARAAGGGHDGGMAMDSDDGFGGGGGGRGMGSGPDPLDLLDESDAVATAAYRCYHLYLGAFLMPHEADWLQATLDKLGQQSGGPGAASTPEKASGSGGGDTFAFPWLRVGNPADLAAIREVVGRWRVMCKTMDPAVMAWIYQSSMQRPAEQEEEVEGPHAHGDGFGSAGEEMDACGSMEQQWREQVREAMIEQIAAMADEEVEAMREAEGDTVEAKRAYLKDHWTKEVDPRTLDLMRHFPSAHREIEFFHTTMLLPVPPPSAARSLGLMDKAQGKALHRLWRPNVTLVCASTPLEALAGSGSGGDALKAAPEEKLTELKFCPFKALRLLHMAPGDDTTLPRQEAFRSAALFFSEVALGLAGLIDAGNLAMEMYLGDVNDLGVRAPGTMDRILLSNVPDYTTLLPPMIKLVPLLKASPGAALKHSVVKFNAAFRDLAEYAHSMGLYVPDMASLPLYLGVNHEYGGLWAHLIEWSRAPGPAELAGEDGDKGEQLSTLPPAADQQAWLATLFLSMAMPLCRDASSAATEIRPLTLHAFFELCQYLQQRGAFPPHNLAWVIEHAMRGEFRTVAVPPDESPWSPQFTWRRHHYQRSLPTGAFALETRTLAGLWQDKLGFRICAPSGQRLPRPEDVTQVTVALGLPEARLKRTGLPLAKVVGVALLHPHFLADHERALDPANHDFHTPAPSPPLGKSPGSLERLSSAMQEEYEQYQSEEEEREFRARHSDASYDFDAADDKSVGSISTHGSADASGSSAGGGAAAGIVLGNAGKELGAIGGGGLRPLLLDREVQRKGQVHLLSCVRWDSRAGAVTVLLPKEDLRALADEGFHLVLLRTDSWLPLCSPVPLTEGQTGITTAAAAAAATATAAAAGGGGGEGLGTMMDVASPEENGGAAGPGAASSTEASAAGASAAASGSPTLGGGSGAQAAEEDDGSIDYKMNRTRTY